MSASGPADRGKTRPDDANPDLPPRFSASEYGRRYALLIGIGKYQDKRIPKLDYTAADAKAMYAVLTDPNHGRFPKKNVRLLLDERATAKNMRRHFTWLRRNARPEDMVIVFYSGHGAPEEGGTYWVPYDADIDDLGATAVGNAYITRELGRIRAERLITFLDSCYSAAIVEKKDKPKALFDQDFFKKFQGTGRVTITASDGKELSLESKELGQGVFTHYLVQALKGKADTNGDGAVELEEVWAHVRRRVTDEAQSLFERTCDRAERVGQGGKLDVWCPELERDVHWNLRSRRSSSALLVKKSLAPPTLICLNPSNSSTTYASARNA